MLIATKKLTIIRTNDRSRDIFLCLKQRLLLQLRQSKLVSQSEFFCSCFWLSNQKLKQIGRRCHCLTSTAPEQALRKSSELGSRAPNLLEGVSPIKIKCGGPIKSSAWIWPIKSSLCWCDLEHWDLIGLSCPRAGCRVAKSDLNSTEAYFATKN